LKAKLKLIPPGKQSRTVSPILDVTGLGKIFDDNGTFLKVLDEVNFSVGKGELICILGRSGCGKSTLLNLLAGFLPPSSGSIHLDGRPVVTPGPDRCVVFQEDTLFPWLTVYENIAFGLKGIHGNKAERAMKVNHFLSLVGLCEFRDYKPLEISGGMKQRVALARVLILAPRVLLMDEPFASLDAQTRLEMQTLLLNLWKEFSHTILFVTHDVVEAITLADRIFVMGRNPGRIRKELHVALPRPRRKDDPQFISLTRTLYKSLGV
jgi:NitT/TauT family transport system ATP-binding protein